MPGLPDIWPDDPSERVLLTIEPVTGVASTAWVADRAEVSRDTARGELRRMESKGWVEQPRRDEWRVVPDARGPGGLLPDDG